MLPMSAPAPEAAPLAGEDDRAYILVGFRLVQVGEVDLLQLVGPRVQAIRSIQRQKQNVLQLFGLDQFGVAQLHGLLGGGG